MRNMLFIITIVFFSCGTNKMGIPGPSKKSLIEPDSIKAIGIWQVPKEERVVHGVTDGMNWVTSPNPDKFIYDGTYITLYLFTEKDWMWKTPDDMYRVRSKWSNDTIFYLPPFGRWEPMATFKDEAFHYNYEIYDSVYSWTYKKIKSEEVDSGYESLVKQRKPHDYSIKPMDDYRE